jgi:hypothetical protein
MLKRRIKQASVEFLSLCPRGKNRMPVVYKSDDMVEVQTLSKFDDDRGELLAVAWAPEIRDVVGDIADRDVTKAMCHSFARNGMNLDIRHDGKAVGKDRAYVAENFTVQKGDERFADWKDYQGNPVDVTGAWAVLVKIDDADLRANYRNGGWEGVSFFGRCALEMEKSEDSASQSPYAAAMRLPKTTSTPPEDTDMPLSDTDLSKIQDMIQKAVAPEPKAAADEPELPDPTDPVAVEKHLKKIRVAKAAASVDWNDPEAVEKHLASIKGETASKEDEGEDTEALKKQISELEIRLQKAQNVSNVPDSAGDAAVQKHNDLRAVGKRMASYGYGSKN